MMDDTIKSLVSKKGVELTLAEGSIVEKVKAMIPLIPLFATSLKRADSLLLWRLGGLSGVVLEKSISTIKLDRKR